MIAFGINQERIFTEFASHNVAQAFQTGVEQFSLTGVETDLFLLSVDQVKGNLRVGQSNPVDDVNALRNFAGSGFQKFEPGRRGIKQIAYFHPGAGGGGCGNGRLFDSAVDFHPPAVFRLPAAGRDGQPGNGGDGRQRLAAETEITDVEQIGVRQLGRCMPLNRQFKIFPRHAFAVVGNRNQRLAAVHQRYFNRRRAGVNGVFNQFFDHRGGTLDHFAGGNLVNQGIGQDADSHCSLFSLFADFLDQTDQVSGRTVMQTGSVSL